MGLQRQVGIAGHEYFVAHCPALIVVRLRTGGAHLPRRPVDTDLGSDRFSTRVVRTIALDLRAHQHGSAVPSLNRYAAVDASIDGQTAAIGDGLLAHFAGRDLPVASIVVVVAG